MSMNFWFHEILECPQEHKERLTNFLNRFVSRSSLRDTTVLDYLNEEFKGVNGMVVLLKGDYNRTWRSEESMEE